MKISYIKNIKHNKYILIIHINKNSHDKSDNTQLNTSYIKQFYENI